MDDYRQPLKLFARNLGVAFQILNDLKDWNGDDDNKLQSGGDVLNGRPTLLWALALDSLEEEPRQELLSLVENSELDPSVRLARVRKLYEQADVFERAHRLVDKHQDRAEAIADEIQPDELRRLLYYLIDTVLQRDIKETSPVIVPTISGITHAAS